MLKVTLLRSDQILHHRLCDAAVSDGLTGLCRANRNVTVQGRQLERQEINVAPGNCECFQ